MSKKVVIAILIGIVIILLVSLLFVFKPWTKGGSKTNEPVVIDNTQNNQNEETLENTEQFGTVLDNGEFELTTNQVAVIDKYYPTYELVEIGMSIDALIEKLGEPTEVNAYRALTYNNWKLDDSGYIKLKTTTDNETNKITEKSILLFSNAELGYQLSKEIKTEIQDLTSELSKVQVGMKLDEVKEILGDKYLERSRNDQGNKVLIWFDLKENSADLVFNAEDVLTEKPVASYKG